MNLGVPEMLFIFVLALLIFGPKKLPEIARQIGHAVTEFRSATNQAKRQLENDVRKLEAEAQSAVPPVITAVSSLASQDPVAAITDALSRNLLAYDTPPAPDIGSGAGAETTAPARGTDRASNL